MYVFFSETEDQELRYGVHMRIIWIFQHFIRYMPFFFFSPRRGPPDTDGHCLNLYPYFVHVLYLIIPTADLDHPLGKGTVQGICV